MNTLNTFWKNEEGDNWFERNKSVIESFTLVDQLMIENIQNYNIKKLKNNRDWLCERL